MGFGLGDIASKAKKVAKKGLQQAERVGNIDRGDVQDAAQMFNPVKNTDFTGARQQLFGSDRDLRLSDLARGSFYKNIPGAAKTAMSGTQIYPGAPTYGGVASDVKRAVTRKPTLGNAVSLATDVAALAPVAGGLAGAGGRVGAAEVANRVTGKAFTAAIAGQTAQTAKAYGSGEISGKQATRQLAGTAAVIVAPEAMKAGSVAARGVARNLAENEGNAFGVRAGELGVVGKKKLSDVKETAPAEASAPKAPKAKKTKGISEENAAAAQAAKDFAEPVGKPGAAPVNQEATGPGFTVRRHSSGDIQVIHTNAAGGRSVAKVADIVSGRVTIAGAKGEADQLTGAFQHAVNMVAKRGAKQIFIPTETGQFRAGANFSPGMAAAAAVEAEKSAAAEVATQATKPARGAARKKTISESVGATTKASTGNVFEKMPMDALKAQADYGVGGAKDELTRRTQKANVSSEEAQRIKAANVAARAASPGKKGLGSVVEREPAEPALSKNGAVTTRKMTPAEQQASAAETSQHMAQNPEDFPEAGKAPKTGGKKGLGAEKVPAQNATPAPTPAPAAKAGGKKGLGTVAEKAPGEKPAATPAPAAQPAAEIKRNAVETAKANLRERAGARRGQGDANTEAVRKFLNENPNASVNEVRNATGLGRSYTHRLMRRVAGEAEGGATTAATKPASTGGKKGLGGSTKNATPTSTPTPKASEPTAGHTPASEPAPTPSANPKAQAFGQAAQARTASEAKAKGIVGRVVKGAVSYAGKHKLAIGAAAAGTMVVSGGNPKNLFKQVPSGGGTSSTDQSQPSDEELFFRSLPEELQTNVRALAKVRDEKGAAGLRALVEGRDEAMKDAEMPSSTELQHPFTSARYSAQVKAMKALGMSDAEIDNALLKQSRAKRDLLLRKSVAKAYSRTKLEDENAAIRGS